MSTNPIEILPHPLFLTSPLSEVQEPKEYKYFGNLDTLFAKTDAAEIVASNSDGEFTVIKKVIDEFLHITHDHCSGNPDQESSVYIQIRMTKPTQNWRIPRWHHDGRYFKPDPSCTEGGKYVTTLLGPPTLFLKPSSTLSSYALRDNEEWKNAQRESGNEKLRKIVDDALKEEERVHVPFGSIVWFANMWKGTADGSAAVHSEPDMSDSDRVFVTVMYGSEVEIGDLCHSWEVEYQV
ncbi:hypothetical protein EJ08DRAFT_699889 [Tothia fuscella]|uniref:Uncharacterized protein n=1 Tax=Tothia fuscella TaxID=1048955 RepID=A0A9P4TVS3_9PEZI|nr:hypothetical protein EJ08DRAFT_699889 [Tothia fuscella]